MKAAGRPLKVRNSNVKKSLLGSKPSRGKGEDAQRFDDAMRQVVAEGIHSDFPSMLSTEAFHRTVDGAPHEYHPRTDAELERETADETSVSLASARAKYSVDSIPYRVEPHTANNIGQANKLCLELFIADFKLNEMFEAAGEMAEELEMSDLGAPQGTLHDVAKEWRRDMEGSNGSDRVRQVAEAVISATTEAVSGLSTHEPVEFLRDDFESRIEDIKTTNPERIDHAEREGNFAGAMELKEADHAESDALMGEITEHLDAVDNIATHDAKQLATGIAASLAPARQAAASKKAALDEERITLKQDLQSLQTLQAAIESKATETKAHMLKAMNRDTLIKADIARDHASVVNGGAGQSVGLHELHVQGLQLRRKATEQANHIRKLELYFDKFTALLATLLSDCTDRIAAYERAHAVAAANFTAVDSAVTLLDRVERAVKAAYRERLEHDGDADVVASSRAYRRAVLRLAHDLGSTALGRLRIRIQAKELDVKATEQELEKESLYHERAYRVGNKQKMSMLQKNVTRLTHELAAAKAGLDKERAFFVMWAIKAKYGMIRTKLLNEHGVEEELIGPDALVEPDSNEYEVDVWRPLIARMAVVFKSSETLALEGGV